MAKQNGWRWCLKCQGLFFSGHPLQGVCPSGGSHDARQSGHYAILVGDGIPGAQDGWRWCQKCQGLFFSGNPDQGDCPAGGKHDGRASGHYSLQFGDNVPGTQGGWRWCQKCQGLFFSGNPDQGDCPAGGKHDSRASGHYGVLWEPTYVFSLDGFRIENTRARHEDSDIISIGLVDMNRNPIVPAVTRDVGDVNNGDYPVGLMLGPVEIDQTAAFALNITNSGYDRSDSHTAEAVTNAAADTVLAAAGAVIGAVTGGVLVPAIASGGAALVGAIAHVVDGLLFTNCDGPVALDGIGVNPDILAGWAANGPHRETHHYTFESQQGCGSSSEYDVTWSVVQADPTWTGWRNVSEGYTTLAMAATSFRNQLYAFAIGTANQRLGTDERMYVNVSADGQNWPVWGWEREVPGNGRTTLPVAATTFRDQLFAFHSGLNQRIYSTTFNGQNWSGWVEVGGNGITSLPMAATTFRDQLFAFGIGTDSKIYLNVFDGQNWSGWAEVGGNGLTAFPVTATVLGNRLFVFNIGTDYRTYSNFTEDGQNWSGWRPVPGQPRTDLPVAATTSNGWIYLSTAWPFLEYTRLIGYPRVAPFGDYPLGNNPYRFYRMLVNVSADGENWSGAQEVSGMGKTRLPLAATDFGGRPYLFAVGTDQKTYFNFRQNG